MDLRTALIVSLGGGGGGGPNLQEASVAKQEPGEYPKLFCGAGTMFFVVFFSSIEIFKLKF